MKTEAYILTLDRAIRRRPQVARLMATCGVPCRPFEAVDGTQLSAGEINSVYRRYLHAPRYPTRLRLGEIGCFLTHRKAWQQIVHGNADVGLVLEDDIELNQPKFQAALVFALSHIRPGDYIKFHAGDVGTNHPRIISDGTHALIKPTVAPLGATSQLITRLAASRLLEATELFDRPVDTFVQMTWLTGVPVSIVTPSCVQEISERLGGSTIGMAKSLVMRFRNELNRPLYRVQIARLSRRHGQSAA
jgi:glycosyl transferase, family 25